MSNDRGLAMLKSLFSLSDNIRFFGVAESGYEPCVASTIKKLDNPGAVQLLKTGMRTDVDYFTIPKSSVVEGDDNRGVAAIRDICSGCWAIVEATLRAWEATATVLTS